VDSLVLNPSTQSRLELALDKPSHAYLFSGTSGLGKTTAAKRFAKKLLGPQSSSGDESRWVLLIEPIEGKKISIKQTAEISNFTGLTKPASISKKVVIIDKADKLGIEAANSLLLLLEEPSADTVIILVADNVSAIPATVLSRLQNIPFLSPGNVQIMDLIDRAGLNPELMEFIGPKPAIIINSDSESSAGYTKAYERAGQFAAEGLAGRLKLVLDLSDKESVNLFFDSLGAVLAESHLHDEAWLTRSHGLILARLHLYNNGNPKFVLEKLALDFE